LRQKKLFISPRKNQDKLDLIPVLQYYFRSYLTYKDGTQRECGSGFTLFFKSKDEISQYDYDKIDIGNSTIIAFGGPENLDSAHQRIDWVNGKFRWV